MNALSWYDSPVGVIYDCIRPCCLLATRLIHDHVCAVSRETQVHQEPRGKVALLGSQASEETEETLVQR